jgi:hypothetical protein
LVIAAKSGDETLVPPTPNQSPREPPQPTPQVELLSCAQSDQLLHNC